MGGLAGCGLEDRTGTGPEHNGTLNLHSPPSLLHHHLRECRLCSVIPTASPLSLSLFMHVPNDHPEPSAVVYTLHSSFIPFTPLQGGHKLTGLTTRPPQGGPFKIQALPEFALAGPRGQEGRKTSTHAMVLLNPPTLIRPLYRTCTFVAGFILEYNTWPNFGKPC